MWPTWNLEFQGLWHPVVWLCESVKSQIRFLLHATKTQRTTTKRSPLIQLILTKNDTFCSTKVLCIPPNDSPVK